MEKPIFAKYYFDLPALKIHKVFHVRHTGERRYFVFYDGGEISVDANKSGWNNYTTYPNIRCSKFYVSMTEFHTDIKIYRDEYKYPLQDFIDDHGKCQEEYQKVVDFVQEIEDNYPEELI